MLLLFVWTGFGAVSTLRCMKKIYGDKWSLTPMTKLASLSALVLAPAMAGFSVEAMAERHKKMRRAGAELRTFA